MVSAELTIIGVSVGVIAGLVGYIINDAKNKRASETVTVRQRRETDFVTVPECIQCKETREVEMKGIGRTLDEIKTNFKEEQKLSRSEHRGITEKLTAIQIDLGNRTPG